MPDGGAITVAARNVEVSAGAAPGGFRDRRRRWGGHARGGPLAGLNVVLRKAPGSGPPASGSARSSASPKDEAARSV